MIRLDVSDIVIKEIRLLTSNEAKNVSSIILSYYTTWWLSNKGINTNSIMCVTEDGALLPNGEDIHHLFAIRPVIIVDNTFNKYDEIQLSNNTTWIAIDQHKLLSNDNTFGGYWFDNISNNYIGSDIEKTIQLKFKALNFIQDSQNFKIGDIVQVVDQIDANYPKIGTKGIIILYTNTNDFIVWWPKQFAKDIPYLMNQYVKSGSLLSSAISPNTTAIKIIGHKKEIKENDLVYIISNSNNSIAKRSLENDLYKVTNITQNEIEVLDQEYGTTDIVSNWQAISTNDYEFVLNSKQSKQKVNLTDLSSSSDLGLDESLFKLL